MDPKTTGSGHFVSAAGIHDFAEERRFDFEQETLKQSLLREIDFGIGSELILDPQGDELR